jgi:uncharacterized protein (DUF488 family)
LSLVKRLSSRIYTIGHSIRSAEELIALLQAASVDLLVDVRSIPRSRRNPQFNIDTLPQTLAEARIGYHHVIELGGRRGAAGSAATSPNAGWREPAFRNYADYALTPEFHAGLDTLLEEAGTHTAAIMCAEAVWWRCHRRIIADYLLVRGIEVCHILGPEQLGPASLTPGAVPQPDGNILYPPDQPRLL